MQLSRSARVTATSALIPLALCATGFQASAAPHPTPQPGGAAFSISAFTSDRLQNVSGIRTDSLQGRGLAVQGFSVMRTSEGETAVVDRSSAREGIIAAAGASFVDLSWNAYAENARYVVTRDGKNIARLAPGITSFRDTGVIPGTDHHYQVAPVLPEGGHPQARLWGLKVSVPASGSLAALRRQAISRASAAGVAATSTLSWITFIPQKKIDAPLAGCDYGRNFQFGGDGRSGFDWKSDKYRTALHATVTWSNKKVVGNKSVRSTTVYVKSTGRKVATKTATDKHMSAKKLGSGGNYVDVRMSLHATNPFCKGLGSVKGAINGAFTINLTKSGNYTIRSGKHRLMPNHHIYIYDGGKVANVYTRKYASASCLIGSIACPEADLTGYHGSF
ncbi:hypothetical protein M4914_05475 [Streptomyces somaliensis DSM 40738]|uniref:Uncharacterized protein n=1 Tax=Streptomyces somaliensis (strain ATCC 33201 / DSM 40738 / JCM 12659 / KCTC 9044 / NCTC 11332 / NRRL B-12077 / IP 733) TaxID=1134445 RepID=A0AA44DDV4_STRE0|nr:hypothetical protein [Streptomyces somaliensis]MCQ0022461.1 hypothetical protein [Streptomyces somaliensis DSM 40738]NKY14595.1 hypothetical protein [Streptomyces somaliensis DSM 40738]